MTKLIGRVAELVRYPIKSMAGVAADSAVLGWHGLAGDRRFAFRRVGEKSGFPWLTASLLPELILYHPCGLDECSGEPLPTHVITPLGVQRELWSTELLCDVAEQFHSAVELMHVRQGVFDDGLVSVVSTATIAGLCRESSVPADSRRFRANIVIDCEQGEPFLENKWLGGTLVFGEKEPRPAVRVTVLDSRCVMLSLNPETAEQDAQLLKTVVRLNQNNAGVYGTVVNTGRLRLGDAVRLEA